MKRNLPDGIISRLLYFMNGDDMLMTNKEAAYILRVILNNNLPPRGSNKSLHYWMYVTAMLRAINVLEETPDK